MSYTTEWHHVDNLTTFITPGGCFWDQPDVPVATDQNDEIEDLVPREEVALVFDNPGNQTATIVHGQLPDIKARIDQVMVQLGTPYEPRELFVLITEYDDVGLDTSVTVHASAELARDDMRQSLLSNFGIQTIPTLSTGALARMLHEALERTSNGSFCLQELIGNGQTWAN